MSGLKAETIVRLFILRKAKSNSIYCSQDYLILKVDNESIYFRKFEFLLFPPTYYYLISIILFGRVFLKRNSKFKPTRLHVYFILQ